MIQKELSMKMERKSKTFLSIIGAIGTLMVWEMIAGGFFLNNMVVYLLALVNCSLIYYNSNINLNTLDLQNKMWYTRISSVWVSAIGFMLSIGMWVWFKVINKETLSERAIKIASIVMFISFACVFLVYIIEAFSLLTLKVLEIRNRKTLERLK
jgi:hypothetical protein